MRILKYSFQFMLSENSFGKIEFSQSARATRIRVQIKTDGLKVTLPFASTENQALEFIHSKQNIIKAKQEKLRQNEKKSPTVLNESSHLQTLTFDIKLKRADRKDIFFSLKDKLLTIEFPTNTDCSTKECQQHFWNGINYFLRKEAKRLLGDRTQQLADKFGFSFTGVKIQSSKTRWGSCSREKSINLSYYLMLLPPHLVDYVILHELCHTKEMNHGDKFWKWMDKVTDGQSKALRRELKTFNMPVL